MMPTSTLVAALTLTPGFHNFLLLENCFDEMLYALACSYFEDFYRDNLHGIIICMGLLVL